MLTIRLRLLALMIGCAAPLAAQGDCKAILEAGSRMFSAPNHIYLTMEIGGKPMVSETIYAGGAMYVKVNDTWSLSPVKPQEMAEMQQKKLDTSHASCRYVKDEVVNGEMAAMYTAHDETPRSKNDTQVWISKAKGLVLREEIDMDHGGGRKSHTSMRCEYGDIKPPM